MWPKFESASVQLSPWNVVIYEYFLETPSSTNTNTAMTPLFIFKTENHSSSESIACSNIGILSPKPPGMTIHARPSAETAKHWAGQAKEQNSDPLRAEACFLWAVPSDAVCEVYHGITASITASTENTSANRACISRTLYKWHHDIMAYITLQGGDVLSWLQH